MKHFVVFFILASLWPWSAHGAQVSSDGIEITFTVRQPVVVLHEPVVVDYKIVNRRSEGIVFDLGPDYVYFFSVRLTRPDGQSSRDLAGFGDGFGEIGRVSLAPNEEFAHQLVFDAAMGIEQLGDYVAELRIQEIFPFRTRTGTTLKPPLPQVVRFRIEPRNAARLNQACNDAATTVLSTPAGSERSDYMKAVRYLAQFVDPIAVPCLQKVMERAELPDDDLFRTMVRIGTPEARGVLQALEKSPDKTRSSRARARLSELSTGRPIFRD
jgi:hypothetical protein